MNKIIRTFFFILFLSFINSTLIAQTYSGKIIAKDFFLDNLDVVLDRLITKYNYKIDFDKHEALKYVVSYAFENAKPVEVIETLLSKTRLKYTLEMDGTFRVLLKGEDIGKQNSEVRVVPILKDRVFSQPMAENKTESEQNFKTEKQILNPEIIHPKSKEGAQIISREKFNYLSLDVVFDKLINSYGYKIAFNKDDVRDFTVSHLFTDAKPQDVLKVCLKETPLTFSTQEDGSFIIYDKKKPISNSKIVLNKEIPKESMNQEDTSKVIANSQSNKPQIPKPKTVEKEYFNYETLSAVFERLISKYDFTIDYNKADVDKYTFSYLITDASPKDAISLCLRETSLDFVVGSDGSFYVFDKKKKEAQTQAIEKTKFIGKASRYNFKISGIVKDKNTGEPLPFVNVSVSRTSNGTESNVDGYFTLVQIPNDTTSLEVSYIGYKNKTIFLTPRTPIDLLIELEPQSISLDEVTVVGEREELLRATEKTSMLKLSPAKIAALPSVGEKDIMRSFQLMPGVSAANENSSGLYVRGGTPDQTLVLYDGFNVYHVEHLFGFFSAFNPNAVKDVQLYKGGFESKFGGRVGSVAEITGKEGNSKDVNFGVDAGFIAANAFVEIPIGTNFTSLIAYRHSYQTGLYDAIFKKYSGSTSTNSSVPARPFGQANKVASSSFYDLNGKFTYKPNTKDIFTLSLYNGTDNLDNGQKTDNSSFGGGGTSSGFKLDINDLTNWGNTGGSLKWSRRFSDKFYMNTLISYSNYFSLRDRSAAGTVTKTDGTTQDFRNGTIENNNLRDYSFKTDFEYKLNKTNQIEFGTLATYNDIKYTYAQSDTLNIIDRKTKGITYSAYLQDKVTFAKGLTGNFGVRENYFEPTAKTYFEPRASFTYDATKEFKIKLAYGQYNQFAKRVIREDIQSGSRDFWVLADDNKLPVSKSIQYVAGFTLEKKDWLIDIEGYYKELTGLTEYSLRIQPDPRKIDYSENYFQGTGKSRGLDILLQKKYGKLNGWISYSVGQTKYNFPNYGANDFYAAQDVTHEFKIVGIYKLGHFDFSATWIYATGRPYTAPSGGYQVTLLDGTTKDYISVTDKNGLRLPDYHRLDVAATYNWKSEGGAPRSIGLSLFNLYDRTNVWYKEFTIESNKVLVTNVNYLGFTPNLNFSYRFR